MFPFRINFKKKFLIWKQRGVSMDESSIARNIKELRIKKGLSLEELASLTGLTRGYLSKIE
ncbi:MAG: helix-turn-helix domain-containing protein, partial [Thermodesulfobacteriota bacterium]